MTYTFKSNSSKSNAKRFLSNTCKVHDDLIAGYLTEHEGKWGVWMNEGNLPVLSLDYTAALEQAKADEEAALAAAVPSAFGAFAMSQLTAVAPKADERAARNSNPTGLKIEKNREERNGIKRPSKGTTCDRVWVLCQQLSDEKGTTVSLAELTEKAMAEGVNQFTARTQYACWRKFNGITGRVNKD